MASRPSEKHRERSGIAEVIDLYRRSQLKRKNSGARQRAETRKKKKQAPKLQRVKGTGEQHHGSAYLCELRRYGE
jgi:hypothetical protein